MGNSPEKTRSYRNFVTIFVEPAVKSEEPTDVKHEGKPCQKNQDPEEERAATAWNI
jgi:hypothetical protein